MLRMNYEDLLVQHVEAQLAEGGKAWASMRRAAPPQAVPGIADD